MAWDVRRSLDLLSEDELRGLAQDLRVEPPLGGSREALSDALAAHPRIAEALALLDRRRLQALLGKLRTRALRDLGARYRVELRGIGMKSDLVTALAGSPVARDILMELEAQAPAEAASVLGGRDSDLDLAKVGDLLGQARKGVEERRFEAAIVAAEEATRLAERTTQQIRRASWSYAILAAQGLLESLEAEEPGVRGPRALLGRAKALYAQGKMDDDGVLRDLMASSRSVHAQASSRLRDQLADVRDSIREAANLGAAIAVSEDAWKRAGDLLDRGDLSGARANLAAASRLAATARDRRIREIEGALVSVEDHIALARNVGADVDEAEALLNHARAAAKESHFGEAGDLVKRAERLAMEGQQRQIQRALEIRRAQMEKAAAVIAESEPLVQEAEGYDLDVTESRTLLRQARDVLAKGDYMQGLIFARNAQEAALRLEPRVAEERRKRGIAKPASGRCGACGSARIQFYDNGWGRCLDCGSSFRWRAAGFAEKVRGLLGT